MKFEYRIANPQDVRKLSILFKHVYIETYGLEGVSDEFANFMTVQFSEEKLLQAIIQNQTVLWVATYKTNLVGVLQVEFDKACPIGNLVGTEINKIYILKRFYGHGIGQQLMKRAEEELIRLHKKQVWLWVLDTNQRAVSFYQKQGYQFMGKADFQMEENTYSNDVMMKEL